MTPVPGKSPGGIDRETLRRIAEKKLSLLEERATGSEYRTPQEIIHELQVHQIELEMQNEALREAQLLLEASHDRFIDLYEFAPVGYLTLSRTATIEEANLTGAALLGVERRDLVNGRFRKYVDPESLDTWDRYFVSVLHIPEKLSCDLMLLRGDGSRFPARIDGLRLDQGPKDPVVRIAISDATREKAMEAELVLRSDEILAANDELTAAGDELRRNEIRLTAALEEREALLAEIHHRVKNNLASFISLLSLDGAHEETETGRQLRIDLQNRARSMALIHETLYRTGNFSKVDMTVYLTTLVSQLAASYAGKREIRTVVDVKGVDLDLSRATTTGLIVSELITNSFKYAFPPEFDCLAARGEPCTIRVVLYRKKGSFVLSVADNGRGMPEHFDPLAAKTLGLKLVNFLARYQLRAEIRVIPDNGSEFVFRMDTGAEVT